MTVVLDWAKTCWSVPDPPQYCSMCGGPIRAPFMHWMCSVHVPDEPGEPPDCTTSGDIFVCAKCCHWHRRGFAADMARVDAVKTALDAGPDYPTLRCPH
jgi:hypothetical protein